MTRARASRAKLELHESGTFNAKQVDADMPRFLPTINPTQINYPIDIRGKWHGNRYRFVQRLSVRPAGDLGRRIRRSIHSLGLDEPRPLRSPMASTHGNLVLPPSRLVAGRGIEDHRSRRAIAPLVASPLSKWALAGSSSEASSPRCSPDANELNTKSHLD